MDNLECEICCNIYDDAKRRPKNVPCGHTFCSQCLAKEITSGKTTCPTCRQPHNATDVEELPISVVLERLIRELPKMLIAGAKAQNSENEGEEDDYSGGPCSKHKKSFVYFYCETHLVQVCRECTVLDHPANKCNVISFKEQIEKRKDDNIHQTRSTVTAINDTLSALGDFVKEKDNIIANQEQKIQQWRKAIEDATKIIVKEKVASEMAQKEISNGKVRSKNVEAAKQDLENANTKKTVVKCSNDIETESANIRKWILDVSTEFDLNKSFREMLASGTFTTMISSLQTYASHTHEGQQRWGRFSAREGYHVLQNFKTNKPPTGARVFNLSDVMKQLSSPRHVYLSFITKEDRKALGTVVIKVNELAPRHAQQLIDLCLGQTGARYSGTTDIDVQEEGETNECLYINTYLTTDNEMSDEAICPDLEERVDGLAHKKGLVLYYNDAGFCITTRSGYTYTWNGPAIGEMVAGMPVLDKIIGDHLVADISSESVVIISECGVFIDSSYKKLNTLHATRV